MVEPVTSDDYFVFGDNVVFSRQYPEQWLRISERVTLAQIRQRLSSYTVEKSTECEGECIHVYGKEGVYLEIYVDNTNAITQITGFHRSRDLRGNTLGTLLTTAVGSTRASCDLGMDTTCQSKFGRVNYVVDDGNCSDNERILSEKANSQYHIASCLTVGGLRLDLGEPQITPAPHGFMRIAVALDHHGLPPAAFERPHQGRTRLIAIVPESSKQACVFVAPRVHRDRVSSRRSSELINRIFRP